VNGPYRYAQGDNVFINLYKQIIDNNKQSGAKRKVYPYFSELDGLLGNRPNVELVAIALSSGVSDQCSTENSFSDIPDDPIEPKKKFRLYAAERKGSETRTRKTR